MLKRLECLLLALLFMLVRPGGRADMLPLDPLASIAEDGPYDAALRTLEKEYYIVEPFSDGRAYASTQGDRYYGYSDKNGEMRIPTTLAYLPLEPSRPERYYIFSEGLAGFRIKAADGAESFGYMDTEGEVRIQPTFLIGGEFHGGLAPVCTLDGQCRYIDRDGNFFTQYESPAYAAYAYRAVGAEGLYPIRDQSGLYGFMNAAGHVVIAPAYASVEPFSEGFAAVCTGEGLYGFIDTLGKMAIPPQFLRARSFSGGVAAVVTEQDRLSINPDDYAWYVENGFWPGDGDGIEDMMPYSYIDHAGRVVLQSITYMPIWEGAATFAPSALDCKNGLLCTYDSVGLGAWVAASDFYNSQGDKANLKRDCAPALQSYELRYLGKCDGYYASREEFYGTLYLQHDRTALAIDEETGATIATYTWASVPMMHGVLLQGEDGEIITLWII